MKDKRSFAWFVVGLTIGIMGIFGFGYIKEYQNIILPLVITSFFAAFVFLLAIFLQKRQEIFRLEYKAHENANLHLAVFDKDFRTYRMLLTAFPFTLPPPPEFQKIGFDYYEKTTDSLSKLISSINALKGFFSSKEFKKIIAQIDENLNELGLKAVGFQKIWQTEYPKTNNDFKPYSEKITKINIEIDNILINVKRKFFNLQEPIFKEMKIP